MDGWIKLHRKIIDNDLWHDVSTFRLFTFLLLKAAHKDGVKVNGIELKQGQFIRSYRKLAEDLSYKEGRGVKQYSLSTIKRCFVKLINEGIVTADETELGTLITVVNYASYQHLDVSENETKNASPNVNRTKSERTQNNNKNEEEYSSSSKPQNVFQIYEQYFGGTLSSRVAEKIGLWIDDLNEDMVIKAMQIAYKKEKRFWGYVQGILEDWWSKGYRTIADIEEEEKILKQPKIFKQDSLEALDAYVKEMGICEEGIF